MPNERYIPFASLSGDIEMNCAVCHSPSKSFNIAGLQIANISILDANIRKRVDKQININEICDVNPFGVEALQAAYTPEGEEWLKALNAHIYKQFHYMLNFVRANMPLLRVSRLEATYLAWIDFSVCNKDSQTIEDELLRNHKLWLNAGQMYAPQGSRYMRINLATSHEILAEGLNRLRNYYNTLPHIKTDSASMPEKG